MHPAWARSIRDQCQAAGAAFFFKQWGAFHPSADHDPDACGREPIALHESGRREWRPSEAFAHIALKEDGWVAMCNVGKKTAGRLLDGREHSEFPEVRT